jgi:metal-dependent HD superfamily phosphatase/phosphodiesterase
MPENDGRAPGGPVTLDDVRSDHEVDVFVRKADENLGVLGYTEHGPRHCGMVADVAEDVLLRLGYPARIAELAAIAGYLHDIGNGINRLDHGIGAALLSRHILQRLGMDADEYAEVMVAIGNHEEEYGQAVSPLAAAVILGDKSDVHRSRVRVLDPETDDIHDRVNMATTRSSLTVDPDEHTITLDLEIDTDIIQVMQYFEIFLDRMVMCRRAAEFLGCRFGIVINGTRLL